MGFWPWSKKNSSQATPKPVLTDAQAEQMAKLNKAFRAKPSDIGGLYRLGSFSLEVGDVLQARRMFRALLLQNLEGKRLVTKAEVFLTLARIESTLGNESMAVKMAERAGSFDEKPLP